MSKKEEHVKLPRQESQKKQQKQERKKRNRSNREFSFVTYFFLVLFLALIGHITYFVAVDSETVINNTYNKRQKLFAETTIRGDILSSDGKVLAETIVNSDGSEVRYYPYANMYAHAIGYSTNGTTGVESIANFSLLRTHTSIVNQVYNMLTGTKNPGDTVVTTLDSELQEVAYHALGNKDGAVIAMDPSTGEILAMVSKPDYNPNSVLTDYDSLIEGEDNSVLLNRATQGSYAPGSVFKIFTAYEYMKQNANYNDFSYECNGEVCVDGLCIHCFNEKAHGTINLEEAFAYSCNSTFASIGLDLDMNHFSKTCSNLLFNEALPTQYPYTKSSFLLNNKSETASIMQGSIGQDTITVSPLHMLLVTSAIANDGVLMKPYVVDYTMNDAGIYVVKHKPEKYSTLMSKEDAAIMQTYMQACVSYGTATPLNTDNYMAGGKTGSAQVSDTTDDTHSWFVGYATDDNGKEIAIAVIVEKQGNGSTHAVPIARKVFDSYFN